MMMRARTMMCVAVVAGAMALAAGPASAIDGSVAARGEIQLLLNKAALAADTKDASGALAIASPDATIELLSGKTVTVAAWQDALAKRLAAIASMKTSVKVEAVEAIGTVGSAIYTEARDYTITKEPKSRYHAVSRWHVILTKTPAGWRISSFKELERRITRDGVSYVPKAPMPAF